MEMQCFGNLTAEQQAAYKTVLLRTLRCFEAFCRREGLPWYMAFGSAIGTVRHGGLIPWDDDIDVYMPRVDYMRFLSFAGRELDGLEAPCEIAHLGTSRQSFSYAKFCDRDSTVVEQWKYPCSYGVFIDVFPLDNVSAVEADARRKAYKAAFLRYKRGFRRPSADDWKASRNRLHDGLAWTVDFLWYRPLNRLYRDRFLALDRSYAGAEGDRRITFDTLSATEKICHDAALFEGSETLQFEGIDVPVPSGNDAILRQIYGDYMQLPPVEKQVTNHYHAYVCLGRRLSYEEALALKNKRV